MKLTFAAAVAAALVVGSVGGAAAQTSQNSGTDTSATQGSCWDTAMNQVRNSADVTGSINSGGTSGSVSAGNSTDTNPTGKTPDPALSSNTGAGAGNGNADEIPANGSSGSSGTMAARPAGMPDC
jgi:hypothetical protein